MVFNVGDLVTRKSYNNDTVFKIIKIDENNNIYLKGITVRLLADAEESDLTLYNKEEDEIIESDSRQFEKIKEDIDMNRDEYFYLPGKVLHIDADHLCNSEFEKVL